MRPRVTFPVLDELRLDLARDVDRNGERQALVAAGAAVDLRIDPDHFAVHVEERPAGIARVDRDVGLYERDVGAVGQRARLGADDTGGDGVVEAVRRADGHDPFADAHRIGIADPDHGQVGRIDLDDRDVGLRVGANDLRGEFALVGEPDEDLGSGAHHVGVGENQAVGAHDEAGSQALRRLRLTAGERDLEAPEEIGQALASDRARATPARRPQAAWPG